MTKYFKIQGKTSHGGYPPINLDSWQVSIIHFIVETIFQHLQLTISKLRHACSYPFFSHSEKA